MTSPTDPENDDFEARLRQVLRAEADTVAPSPEALDLIRGRTAGRGVGAWFGLPWLRPVLAVAGAVLIAASVVMSTPQVREQVLEMVPAGADRQSTPPGQDGGDVAAPSLEDEATEHAPRIPEPRPSPEPSDDPSEPVEDEEEGGAGGPAVTAECPTPSPSAGVASKDDKDDKDDGEPDEECEPSEEPSPGGGTDPGTDPGGGGGTDPGTGGGDTGNGGGSTGGTEGGTDQQTSTAD